MEFSFSAMGLLSIEIRDPGEDPEAFRGDIDWSELSAAEQALWMVLG